ncbi:MAG: hypothetical protein BWY42_01679 [Candidatus Omnitrophica bacterium ADurb.Bin277]|nr:MAG: hypothetical protein BWY42_01679 [Candidatus Omnitrophica bacterium ADurb.Bin277]
MNLMLGRLGFELFKGRQLLRFNVLGSGQMPATAFLIE